MWERGFGETPLLLIPREDRDGARGGGGHSCGQQCFHVGSGQDSRARGSLKGLEQLRGLCSHAVPQLTAPVRCWTSHIPLGSQQQAHTVGQAAAPPPPRQLRSPQTPALASGGANEYEHKASIRFSAWQRQSSSRRKASQWGSELPPQPGGTSLSLSPSQHPRQPGHPAQSPVVLQVMREQEAAPILAWLLPPKAQRSQKALSQELTRLGLPNHSHLAVCSIARLFAIIGMQTKPKKGLT